MIAVSRGHSSSIEQQSQKKLMRNAHPVFVFDCSIRVFSIVALYIFAPRVAVLGGSRIDGLRINGSRDEHIPLFIGDVYKYCVSVVSNILDIIIILLIMTKRCTHHFIAKMPTHRSWI